MSILYAKSLNVNCYSEQFNLISVKPLDRRDGVLATAKFLALRYDGKHGDRLRTYTARVVSTEGAGVGVDFSVKAMEGTCWNLRAIISAEIIRQYIATFFKALIEVAS